ncbi:hypothetical protein NSP_32170 [Nodularia spumigena CCY9414]|nr:hypothetical protein NSP_32170 [Nodularia spumigena CCY9414]
MRQFCKINNLLQTNYQQSKSIAQRVLAMTEFCQYACYGNSQ